MKHIFKILTFSMMALVLWSCEKDENRITFEGGTAPVATSTKTGTIPLTFATSGEESFRLDWTNPNYKFTTGVSSQNVSYTIEIDTTGANFTNPKKKALAISSSLSKTFTQGELNDYLLNTLELKAGMPHQIEMRVIASLASGAGQLPSNVLKFNITPYAIPPKVAPPASGKLFITGGATPKGWQCACGEPEETPQMFTQKSPTLYELERITLKGGESFLFLPVYGSWAAKYGFIGDGNKNNVDGDEIKDGGNDIKAPAASGDYKIVVNFQTGKYTLTKL